MSVKAVFTSVFWCVSVGLTVTSICMVSTIAYLIEHNLI